MIHFSTLYKKLYCNKCHLQFKQTSPLHAVAIGSRCMNSEESSSSSFFECFLSVVCSRRAWYLTGNPYLEQKTSNNPMYTSELELWNCFNNLAHTWELTQQTPLMLSNESRQQTTHWNLFSASAQNLSGEEKCPFIKKIVS